MLADAARGGLQIFQIGRAVRARRRAHRDENHLRARDGMGVVGGEFQIATSFGHQFDEPGLVKRDGARIEGRDLARVGVGAGDFVSQEGETDTRSQAYVSGSKNGNVHKLLSYDGKGG